VTHSKRLIHKGFLLGFLAVASLFFLWAVANNLNDILIRQFQKALELSRTEAGFIQFVFYIGYFVFAIPAGLIARRFGYRGAILFGLSLYGAGALLFYPAAETRSYAFFLFALFTIAVGVATLETAANPYISRFGAPERAAQRLNLAQAFNGLGAFLAPLVGGLMIFSGTEIDDALRATMSAAEYQELLGREASAVQTPYLIVAAMVALVAVLIALVKLPEIDETVKDSPDEGRFDEKTSPLHVPHLRAAVIAQFFYVGAQVALWSFFIDFAVEISADIGERGAALLLSANLAMFVAGRFGGAALMARIAPERLLLIAGIGAMACCAVALAAPPMAAVTALVISGLFMSIMFPTIFSLGVADLGRHTKLASSLIIMAIIGGALFPPASGWLIDQTGSLRLTALAPLIGFTAVTWFAWRYRALMR
jgi:FHS family L-fucose permease-like MFS transporter